MKPFHRFFSILLALSLGLAPLGNARAQAPSCEQALEDIQPSQPETGKTGLIGSLLNKVDSIASSPAMTPLKPYALAALKGLKKTGRFAMTTHDYAYAYLTYTPYTPMSARKTGFAAGAVRTAKSLAWEASRILVPIPGFRIHNEITTIFDRLIENPFTELNAAEAALLRKNNAYKLYQLKLKILRSHPGIATAQKSVRRAIILTSILTYLLIAEQALEIEQNTQNFESFADNSKDANGNPVVQLLIETMPFPHTALRIGDRVYSYGVHQMTVSHVHEYMNKEDPWTDQEKNPDATSTDWIYEQVLKLGAGVAKRQVRFINLNLTTEEIFKLQRDLESQKGKMYKNYTMINDCSTMAFRALERNTSISISSMVDPYPNTSLLYLTMLRNLGDEKIGKNGLAVPERIEANISTSQRNMYIAFLESRLLMLNLVWNHPVRLWIDAANDDSDLQDWTDSDKAFLEEKRNEARKEILHDWNLNDYLASSWTAAQAKGIGLEEFKKRIAPHFDIMIAKSEKDLTETLSLRELDLIQLLQVEEKLHQISLLRNDWKKRVEEFRP